MDAPTHLKPGKYKLITEAGPTALFFILLLINLSVSPSCLLATDNKEAKHFSLCFMSLSCTQSRWCSSDVFLFSPAEKGSDRPWRRIVMSWIHLINKNLADELLLRVDAKHEKLLSYFCAALMCWSNSGQGRQMSRTSDCLYTLNLKSDTEFIVLFSINGA